MGGLNLITAVKSLYPDIKILVLTTYYDEKNVIQAVFNGADGYILKSAGRESIINAVKNTISGKVSWTIRSCQRCTPMLSRRYRQGVC
jgi:DNA-binding NarL/FixJ family response regulator